MTIKAGVIGWPIEHSLSPVLHGYWLKQYGIEGSYEKIAAPPEDFAATIQRLRAEDYAGVNVTVPHKETAFALADSDDDATRIAGAANLLIFDPDRIRGVNTDAYGLMTALLEEVGMLDRKNVVLLGSGGAARGAIIALKQLGGQHIHLLARNPDRALALAENFSLPSGHAIAPGNIDTFRKIAADIQLVVNATSAGMGSNPPLDLDLSALPQGAAVCDIVYHPLETPLLKDAKARGLKTIDGLGMLMHQAAPSFAAFFGIYPSVTPGLRAALVEALGKR